MIAESAPTPTDRLVSLQISRTADGVYVGHAITRGEGVAGQHRRDFNGADVPWLAALLREEFKHWGWNLPESAT